jgi:hypothetical protein
MKTGDRSKIPKQWLQYPDAGAIVVCEITNASGHTCYREFMIDESTHYARA